MGMHWHGSAVSGGNNLGRWPANLLHDGSEDVLALFPDVGASKASIGRQGSIGYSGGAKGIENYPRGYTEPPGSAARFFYCAKASQEDRDAGLEQFRLASAGEMTGGRRNIHPTVKPTDLMRWLVRLAVPPGGIVLDPFMGSGSTGKAAMLEGLQFVGIELSPEYLEIARRRIDHARSQPDLFIHHAPEFPQPQPRQAGLFDGAETV